jgi:hypothetical protein
MNTPTRKQTNKIAVIETELAKPYPIDSPTSSSSISFVK